MTCERMVTIPHSSLLKNRERVRRIYPYDPYQFHLSLYDKYLHFTVRSGARDRNPNHSSSLPQ